MPCQPAVVVFVVVFSLFFSLLMISGVCTCSRFAYIEFVDKSSITQALDLDDSLFKGRQIKVSLPTHAQHMIVMWYNNSQQVVTKRTNRPGVSTTNRGGRMRGRGRGGFRGTGGYNPYMGGMMMMPMPPMGYYRGGRGRTFR